MSKGVKNSTLGEYVKARRLAGGLDTRTCFEHAGLSESYWYRLENGEVQRPDPALLRKVAETISCPAEDLYALCDYPIPDTLPTLTPYLRTKYDLPPEAVRDMERYFAQLRSYYGIPDDEPVFPPQQPLQDRPHRRGRPSKQARNSAKHPWRAPADRGQS